MRVFYSSVIFLVVFIVTSFTANCSIIVVEDAKACFRRVLAGKRVSRGFVKKALSCERVEDCQQECAEEKHFICEGFNYRLDPTGRGKGDCELLDLPLSRLDIGRDVYPDPEYDYYEKDRNAAAANCRGYIGDNYYPSHGGGGGYYSHEGGSSHSYGHGGGSSYNHDYGYDYRRPGGGGTRPGGYEEDHGLRRPGEAWPGDRDRDRDKDRYGSGSRRPRPRPDFDRIPDYNRRPSYDEDYRPSGNRRGDYSYHHSHHSQQNYENSHSYHYYHYDDRDDYDRKQSHGYQGIHYLPGTHHRPHYESPYDYKSYEPYLPPNGYHNNRRYDNFYEDRERDRNYWGFDKHGWSYGNFGQYDQHRNNGNRYDYDRRNYYLPPAKVDRPKHWGLYGGSYGTGGLNLEYNGYGHGQGYDYWGFTKLDDKYNGYDKNKYNNHYDGGNGYLPLPSKPFNQDKGYLPLPHKPSVFENNYYGSHHGGSHTYDNVDNSLLPAEPRQPPYNYFEDECSLRTATGFRLHKGIVKKFRAVPNIYECELLCFRESDFVCSSYAFRYTISPSNPTSNCYLSNRNYKELDFYTDLEPDRDFDIYTMNNPTRCTKPVVTENYNSECFWRVRSGQRLDHKVVRDTLTVPSIVDCQIECIHSTRFTCRAFSFRYGSPNPGGAIDNCQLTDWPFFELDPRHDFIPEPGFEVYERGSFGHGCEPNHFGIRGKHEPDSGTKIDQLCYIGFGSPARLLPQATRKSLWVPTELDCKAECSKLREGTLFQCMSFSYRSIGPKDVANCDLSDILQRDLLPNVDYVADPDSWLFAWNNYNPQCIALAHEPVHINGGGGNHHHNAHVIKIDDRVGNDLRVLNGLDTWKVYSVSGWPCRRGSLCKENREAGFWYCELEGGNGKAWDYCCRPDHQCGSSRGYPYQWCYVGPAKTQWRKCSDQYYPYIHNIIDRFDNFHGGKPYLHDRIPPHKEPWVPNSLGSNFIHDIRPPPPYRPGGRPDRPPALPTEPPPRPSLDEYEMQFDNQFLEPPKPGGFGQPRHWPVSYLHQEMPPNNTDSEPRLMRVTNGKDGNPKYAAIQSLINIIKSNDLKNVQYHIANESNKEDDILFVKIPLPTNFTQETSSRPEKMSNFSFNTTVSFDPVNDNEGRNNKRTQKSLPLLTSSSSSKSHNIRFPTNTENMSVDRPLPVYRKSYITRTNVTRHGRSGSSRTF